MGSISRVGKIAAVMSISVMGALALNSTKVGATYPPTSGYTVALPPTPAQVNTSITDALDFIDFQQNANGSFGSAPNGNVPETAGAIIAYGVLDRANIANLPTSVTDPAPPHATHNFQTDLTNAVSWLLGQQDKVHPIAVGQYGGSWTLSNFYYTYSTGLALAALSFSSTVPTTPANAIATAIANGRSFLENEFQGPPNAVCTTVGPGSSWCGGWNYDAGFGRSDQSNSGFAITGLALTGGVPAAIRLLNTGWNNNIQADSATNPTYAGVHNDGGGAYIPGCVSGCGSFHSNANDSGSMLFSLADDGLTTSDPRVQAGLQFGTDVFDTYEKAAHSIVSVRHNMVFHNNNAEDGSCDPSAGGCDWAYSGGEGGFHYSMFSLSKGVGAFIPPVLNDGTNWYAKMTDLLVNQQATNAALTTFGSWPQDGRDDFSSLFATELSVFAVGLAATPPPPVGGLQAGSFHVNGTCSAVHLTWTNPSSANYGGLRIRRRTDTFPTSNTDGTLVTNADAPATSFNDTGLVPNSTYFYSGFPYDVTKQVFGPASHAQASTVVCTEVLATTPPTPSAGGPAVGVPAHLAPALLALGGCGIAVSLWMRSYRRRPTKPDHA